MFKVGLLDCTLRDGGYVVDTVFGKNTITEIISCLCETGIDIIECGFLRNEKGIKGSTVFSRPDQLKEYLPSGESKSKYVLMFDAGKLDVDKLPDNDGTVFGIRDCFHSDFRAQAFEDAKKLKEKGYEVFIQPTGILQYTDSEILDLVRQTNAVGAYSFAIVDTFGSMEKPDLVRLFYLVHHNLDPNIVLSFHSHNNQQMAYALSQDFVALGIDKRQLLVDATVYGMGRGAGNACTESVAFHLNKYYGRQYDTEKLLDLIENQILQIYDESPWGYNVRNLVAGIYGCHVDNVSYLYDKGNILSSDVKRVLEDVPPELRIHFHGEVLERTLENYRNEFIDDAEALDALEADIAEKNVLVICPGRSVRTQKEKLDAFTAGTEAVKIGVNFVPQDVECDYLFFSNPQRLHFWRKHIRDFKGKIIVTSDITAPFPALKINHRGLVYKGRKYGSNAMIICLKLLDKLKAGNIFLAGFDGYSAESENYVSRESESSKSEVEKQLLNYEISEMLADFKNNMQTKRKFEFVTDSRFEEVLM